MEIAEGKSIYKGTVIGKIYFYKKNQKQVKRQHVTDCARETERFEEARKTARKQLEGLYEKAVTEVGETNAMIFQVHAMLLEDGDFKNSVINIITGEEVNAEYAVAATGDNLAKLFSDMEDAYFKARAADMKDISERVIRVLQTAEDDRTDMTEPSILVAEDLAPSETVQLDKNMVLSFVTRFGSANSHTAILARAMGLPSLFGVEIKEEWHGKQAIVDGNSGKLIVEPDSHTLSVYEEQVGREAEREKLLKTLKGQPNETRDGKRIELFANIGNVSDVAKVLVNDAGGIGLFRSEFLYLEKKDYPTEEEQFQAYKAVAQNMAGKKVVIRTLDIGADKQAGYFGLEQEANPAMGYRAVRLCLDRVEVFKTQLRALYRASAYGNISVMVPMIISVEEVLAVKRLCREVMEELREEGLPYKDIELGIMIETPAAVMISDMLAKEVDFFSIGTNDLTQYTLAIDRQNPRLDKLYDAHHEAVLRMIKLVIENGHAEGCWVGICGELAADTTLTEQFIQMGIDELSVSPSFVLPVRRAIREAVSK